jgi:dihydrofolate reductase
MAGNAQRLLRYNVAMSLDGFIAGPKGEYDWIIPDPTIDFAALFRQFDTAVVGRRSYETMLAEGQTPSSMGMKVFVASTTLRAEDHPAVTILNSGVTEAIAKLKAQQGKDIWLFGGGVLFRSLLDAGLVDMVELAVVPVLLGGGVRLLPEGRLWPLRFKESKTLPSGIQMLSYFAGPEATQA